MSEYAAEEVPAWPVLLAIVLLALVGALAWWALHRKCEEKAEYVRGPQDEPDHPVEVDAEKSQLVVHRRPDESVEALQPQPRGGNRCKAAGCTQPHSAHYCDRCGDSDSDHRARDCRQIQPEGPSPSPSDTRPTVERTPGNMLAAAYESYSAGSRVGYLIAGNAGKVGGGLLQFDNGQYDIEVKTSPFKRDGSLLPQEEGSLTNFMNADLRTKAALLECVPHWGMVDYSGRDHRTSQGVDYSARWEVCKGDQAAFKYGRCVRIGDREVRGFSQEGVSKHTAQRWDTQKQFQCRLYITVGPQARCPDTGFGRKLAPDSSMRRTFDRDANEDPAFLRQGVIEALRASLETMDEDDVCINNDEFCINNVDFCVYHDGCTQIDRSGYRSRALHWE